MALGGLAFCIVNMLAAYATFAESLAHVEASRVSTALASVPIATLSIVHLGAVWRPQLFTPEPLGTGTVIGALLVVGGSLLTATGPARRRAQAGDGR